MASNSIRKTLLVLLEHHFDQSQDESLDGSLVVQRFPPIAFEGFLQIELCYYDAYTGRNPATGDKLEVPGKYVAAFRMDEKMARYLNEEGLEIEPIRPPADVGALNIDELLRCLTEARERLLKGETAELPGVLTLSVRSKEGWNGSPGRKVLSVENLSTDRDDDPKNQYFSFEDELNRRLNKR